MDVNLLMKDELLRQKRIHGLPEVVTKLEEEFLHKGVPVQKIIGFINFDNLVIKVNRDVLIPRYETEEVVLEALKYINNGSKVLDLCCGSGYIGLTIKQKTGADVFMSDISDEAILQTKENAELNNLKVTVIKSDLFENIKEKFDVIVSNPPYIPLGTNLDASVIDHEPHNALFGGVDGNDIYKRIIAEAESHLNPNGLIVFEISPDNAFLVEHHGFRTIKDINGKKRIAIKQFSVL